MNSMSNLNYTGFLRDHWYHGVGFTDACQNRRGGEPNHKCVTCSVLLARRHVLTAVVPARHGKFSRSSGVNLPPRCMLGDLEAR